MSLRLERSLPLLLLFLLVVIYLPTPSGGQTMELEMGVAGLGIEVPTKIHLRAGVLHAPPFAMVEEEEEDKPQVHIQGTSTDDADDEDGAATAKQYKYSGFQPTLLERMKQFAASDNVTLTFDLQPSPPQYGAALDWVANDCNTSYNPNSYEDCNKFDVIIGDYYCNPARSVRIDFTPSWLRTTMSTIKYIDKSPESRDYTTLTQADGAGATVCVPDGTYLMTVVMAKFPNANYIKCGSPTECIDWLQTEQCVLYADDELLLRYRQSVDPSLEVTREQFNTQYLVWPMRYDLPPVTTLLFKKWMYMAVSNATLDELYGIFFQKALCPVGTAGPECDLPCDPDHGTANARGECICESIKWTGADCSIEVEEEINLIPTPLKYVAYGMFGCNVVVIGMCGIWLVWQRDTAQVRVSQPSFLLLVLMGCLISSSTILAMAQESGGEGPVHACMAIPWLYSVGFSVTFGTLFAKIRRVYLIFMKAAQAQSGAGGMQRKNRVTFQETVRVIALVLFVDLLILVTWTVMDPLQWERTVITADQFGVPLESEGFCTSEHWTIFAGLIAILHLLLMAVACYMCYVARDIPTKFSEGKYLAIAMISNLQIFVVGVPILIILGPDPQTSFFVRSVIIWMNDLAVVTLIFGNLMWSVHVEAGDGAEKVKAAVGQAMNRYSTHHQGDKHMSSSFDQQPHAYTGRQDSNAEAPLSRNRQSIRKSSTRSRDRDRRRSSASGVQSSIKSSHSAVRMSCNHTPSQVSWGEVDEGVDVMEENDDTTGRESFADEDHSKPFVGKEEEDRIAPLKESPKSTVKDVLKNNRMSWGGVNLSTTAENDDSSQSETPDNAAFVESRVQKEGAPIHKQPSPNDENSDKKQRLSISLPPASLPKPKSRSSTYAQLRISQIRERSAQIRQSRHDHPPPNLQ